MEKKVTKKFYLLTAFNIIPAIILGWGNLYDTLVMIGVLIALALNHHILVKIISDLAKSMSGEPQQDSPLVRILGLLFVKMMLLGAVLVLAYYYNPALVPKVMLLMIFQLIIQVVSIKNNY